MIFLLLAVGCSLSIGMIFKHAGREGLDRVALLTTNYAAAALLGLLFIALGAREASGGLALRPGLLALGVGTGVLFIAGFYLLSLATDVAGMSVATGVMRVAVVIPFLASWLVWGEAPTPTQGAGLVLAAGAFFMIASKRGSEHDEGEGEVRARSEPAPPGEGTRRFPGASREEAVAVAAPPAAAVEAGANGGEAAPGGAGTMRTAGVLALLFLAGGAVDTCMKAFDEAFADEASRALFLLMIFGVAFLIGAADLMRRRPRLAPRTLAWGVLLGAVNYGSVEFILRAIRALRGPFVFPANNISIVIGAALLGLWFWGEHLSTLNKAGLAVAALALFLLRP